MPKIKKSRQKRGLADKKTFITDTSQNSPQYFNVSQLNNELVVGKNGFSIQGTKNLKSGAEILIEILDSRGDVIYHEIRNYKEDVKRVVGVFVYQDTPPGQGTITVLSEAIRDSSGVPVPKNQRDRLNVKWSRSINVNPNSFNEDQIRFIRTPEILLNNEVYIKKRGSFITEESSFIRLGDPDFTPIEISDEIENITSFPLYSVPGQDDPLVSAVYYPPIQWVYEFLMIKAKNFSWTDNMEGRKLYISKEVLPLDQNMVIRVDEIINKNYARFEVLTDAYLDYTKKITFDTEKFFFLYKKDPFIYEEGEAVYLKNIQLGFIKTLTGECIRAQVYNRLRGEDSTFNFIGNFEIEPVELLTDMKDTRVNLIKPVGEFESQSQIDRFLTSSSNCDLVYDEDVLSNSVSIQPNILGTNQTYEAFINFQNPDIQRFTLFSYSEYTLSFQTTFSSDEKPIDSSLSVYVAGPPFFDTRLKLGEIDLTQETFHITDVSKNFFPSQTTKSVQSGSIGGSLKIIFEFTSQTNSVDHSWNIRDISLRPAQEAGFSPDYTILKVPIDTTKYGSNELSDLIYKVDLFDVNNNKAGVNLISS